MDIEKRTLYWLAGLLEAEGSFIVAPPSEPYRPRISISMTDEDVIARVAEIFRVKYHSVRPRNTKHKVAYMASVRGRRAMLLMRELYPLMSRRRQEQIDRVFAKHIYRPNNKGENHGNAKLTEEQVRQIKTRLGQGEAGKRIAKDFNISQRAVSDINCDKTWGHIIP